MQKGRDTFLTIGIFRKPVKLNQLCFSKAIVLPLFICLFFTSCLKNKDNTANGPKSQVAVTNFVVNDSINILYDNTAVTKAPLAFGGGLATTTSGYVSFAAGLHNFKVSSGTTFSSDNTIAFQAGSNYSLFFYDTLQNSKLKSLLLKDDLSTVNTIANLRFLQFIPESDSLTISFKKDTTYILSDAYVGKKTNPESAFGFSYSLTPGSYQVNLVRNGNSIFRIDSLLLQAGKFYSFIARGVVNGTGTYKEAMVVVQNN
jgi:hypothetical protein